jgi:hypothetical protein
MDYEIVYVKNFNGMKTFEKTFVLDIDLIQTSNISSLCDDII